MAMLRFCAWNDVDAFIWGLASTVGHTAYPLRLAISRYSTVTFEIFICRPSTRFVSLPRSRSTGSKAKTYEIVWCAHI